MREREITIAQNEKKEVIVDIYPTNYQGTEVAFTSDNEAVATVDENGMITGIASGDAVITATVGDKTATCTVHVKEETATTYTVTFNSNGGSDVASETVGEGQKVAKPADPTRDGFTFTGWYTDEGCTKAYDFATPVTSDLTLYAGWEEDSSSSGTIVTRYNVTVEESSNGTVKVSNSRPSAGLTVTVTLTPDEGYKADGVTVTDAKGNAVAVTNKGDGKYTFRMPRSNVTVKASFTKDDTPVETGLPFTDVKSGDWFYEAVKYVYDNKLMDGTSSTTFAPLMTTNRAMVVTILWRLEGQPETDATLSFTDVESGVWYTAAVNWAASKGIVKGYSDTVFAPNDTVTREQLATILYRYAEHKEYDVTAKGDLTTFADGANTSSWAAEAMEWAVGSGLLSGKDGGKLDPTGTATRAEIATILMRFAGNEK